MEPAKNSARTFYFPDDTTGQVLLITYIVIQTDCGF